MRIEDDCVSDSSNEGDLDLDNGEIEKYYIIEEYYIEKYYRGFTFSIPQSHHT